MFTGQGTPDPTRISSSSSPCCPCCGTGTGCGMGCGTGPDFAMAHPSAAKAARNMVATPPWTLQWPSNTSRTIWTPHCSWFNFGNFGGSWVHVAIHVQHQWLKCQFLITICCNVVMLVFYGSPWLQAKSRLREITWAMVPLANWGKKIIWAAAYPANSLVAV